MKKFKLKIELIPSNNWGINLRRYYSNSEWNKIRKEELEKSNYSCSICGNNTRKLNCHEEWEFDDEKWIQKFASLKIVCDLCHHCNHPGRLGQIDYTGEITKKVIEHFLSINNCSYEEYVEHKKEAWKLFRLRSKKRYSVDFGDKVNDERYWRGEFKVKVAKFRKYQSVSSNPELLLHDDFIRRFENEIIETFVSAYLKPGIGNYRIILEMKFQKARFSKDFFKLLLEKLIYSNQDISQDVLSYFGEKGHDKFAGYYYDLILGYLKTGNRLAHLISKLDDTTFILYLTNNDRIIDKLSDFDVFESVKILGKIRCDKNEKAFINKSYLFLKYKDIALSKYHSEKEFAKRADEFFRLEKERNTELRASKIKSENYETLKDYVIDENDFKCPYCGSKEFIKGGKTQLGKFRYKCKYCSRNFSSIYGKSSKFDTQLSNEDFKKIMRALD